MPSKGYKQTEDHKRKLSEALKDRKQTEEHRKKISEAHKRMPRPELRGKPLSEEHRRKISEAHKGRKFSEEHKRKLSEGKKDFKNPNYGRIREQNPNWKGGRIKTCNNYIFIKFSTHPRANAQGYVPESRLIIEKHLGRTLLPTEVVHHINGVTNDNRIENLMLFNSSGNHISYHVSIRVRDSRGRFMSQRLIKKGEKCH